MGQYSTGQLVSMIQQTAYGWGLDPNLGVEQLRWESGGFNPVYVYGPKTSSAGAMGIAQFIPSTGHAYGLINTADFYNPDKAIPAWAHLMSDLLNSLGGRYDLALAGYNWGPSHSAIRSALSSGNSILYYSIPAQTRTYITNIFSNAGYDPYSTPSVGNVVIDQTPIYYPDNTDSTDSSSSAGFTDSTFSIDLPEPVADNSGGVLAVLAVLALLSFNR